MMPEKKSSKVKIFVGYYKPNIIFESDVYQPIITSDIPWENKPNVIRDNTGTNIAAKNKNYGELSGNYWVWKNYLPTSDAEYIGYCHYRRFLDFNLTPIEILPFKPILSSQFKKIFKKYTEKNILKCIEGYDIVLPQKLPFLASMYEQYIKWHPKKDMDLALMITKELYPEYLEAIVKTVSAKSMYTCLHFVMKKELFEEYMEWLFSILTVLEDRSDWTQYNEYLTVRIPAYIAERLLNIWLTYNVGKRGLKVRSTTSILVVGKGYGSATGKECVSKYNLLIQLMKEKNLI